jgi:hypothetical protein
VTGVQTCASSDLIHEEMQNLFMMASLDKDNGFKKDFIMTYFDFQDDEGYRIETFVS